MPAVDGRRAPARAARPAGRRRSRGSASASVRERPRVPRSGRACAAAGGRRARGPRRRARAERGNECERRHPDCARREEQRRPESRPAGAQRALHDAAGSGRSGDAAHAACDRLRPVAEREADGDADRGRDQGRQAPPTGWTTRGRPLRARRSRRRTRPPRRSSTNRPRCASVGEQLPPFPKSVCEGARTSGRPLQGGGYACGKFCMSRSPPRRSRRSRSDR